MVIILDVMRFVALRRVSFNSSALRNNENAIKILCEEIFTEYIMNHTVRSDSYRGKGFVCIKTPSVFEISCKLYSLGHIDSGGTNSPGWFSAALPDNLFDFEGVREFIIKHGFYLRKDVMVSSLEARPTGRLKISCRGYLNDLSNSEAQIRPTY